MTVQREASTALGQGLRLGFLGSLHMDVFRQRLEDEYDANVIITAPTVPYKSRKSHCFHRPFIYGPPVVYRGHTEIISNPTDFPDLSDTTFKVIEVQEPMVKVTIVVPGGEDPLSTERGSWNPCISL